jgi:transcription elongation factor S-II
MGKGVESEVFRRTCIEIPDPARWDLYEFRRQYKRLSIRILENLSYESNSLRQLIIGGQTLEEVLDLDHRLWDAGLWREFQTQTEESDGGVEEEKSLYPCNYCRRKKMYAYNTTYYAQQTRSADEPMTVFLHCHSCGKNEKFSS